jgi:hypothetical protein
MIRAALLVELSLRMSDNAADNGDLALADSFWALAHIL